MSVMDTGGVVRACYNLICMSKQIMWLYSICFPNTTDTTQHMQALYTCIAAPPPHCCIASITIFGHISVIFHQVRVPGGIYS